MSVPGLDFGLFVAYVLPGAVVLFALSLLSLACRRFLTTTFTQANVGATLLVVVLALAAGRIISIGRAALIDPSFEVPLPLISCNGAPQRGGIQPVPPDYRQLIDAGHREAYLIAVAGDQRQYQFCGNTLLASILCIACALVALRRDHAQRARMLWLAIALMGLAPLLYGGARSAYYSFMRSVAQINGSAVISLDRTGTPCRAATP